MEFDIKFKTKCFKAFQHSDSINDLMQSLEANDTVKVRRIIEDYLDNLDRVLKPELLVDDGERIVYNAKVKQFKDVHALYSELIESINIEMDSKIREHVNK